MKQNVNRVLEKTECTQSLGGNRMYPESWRKQNVPRVLEETESTQSLGGNRMYPESWRKQNVPRVLEETECTPSLGGNRMYPESWFHNKHISFHQYSSTAIKIIITVYVTYKMAQCTYRDANAFLPSRRHLLHELHVRRRPTFRFSILV